MPRRGNKNDHQKARICRDGDNHYFRLFDTLVNSKAYISLSGTAKNLYTLMGLESKGRDKFYFPESKALNQMTKSSFQRAKRQLIEKGFIEATSYRTQKTEYKFSEKWKSEQVNTS